MNQNVIAVAGDWHIDSAWAVKMLTAIAEEGVSEVQHVGDFGFDSTDRGISYLNTVNEFSRTHNMTVNVTPGNHENFPFLHSEFIIPTEDGFLTSERWNHISVIPRGHRWTRNGTTFVSLGGANSINRYSLTPNIDWWEEEQISLGDVYRTVEGGKADVMIAHDCPASVPFEMSDTAWPAHAVAYAKESRMMVEQAVSAVKPDVFFHGHHHTYHDMTVSIHDGEGVYQQRVVGLNMNGYDSNIALLNIAEKEYSLLRYGS